MDIDYRSGLDGSPVPQARDFFIGWPRPPGQEQFVAALCGSHAVELAVHEDRVIGYVNAISDGVATAFIPWLEVTPAYQGRGIGSELMRRIVARLSGLYSIDLVCDPALVPYHRRLGMAELAGLGLRFPANLHK